MSDTFRATGAELPPNGEALGPRTVGGLFYSRIYARTYTRTYARFGAPFRLIDPPNPSYKTFGVEWP